MFKPSKLCLNTCRMRVTKVYTWPPARHHILGKVGSIAADCVADVAVVVICTA